MRSQRCKTSTGFFLVTAFITALLLVSSPAWTACRDLDLARPRGSVAYAAEANATIQYFGHNFFLINPERE